MKDDDRGLEKDCDQKKSGKGKWHRMTRVKALQKPSSETCKQQTGKTGTDQERTLAEENQTLTTPKPYVKVQTWLQTMPESLSSVDSKLSSPQATTGSSTTSSVIPTIDQRPLSDDSDNEEGLIHYKDDKSRMDSGEEDNVILVDETEFEEQETLEERASRVFPGSTSTSQDGPPADLPLIKQRKRIFKTRSPDFQHLSPLSNKAKPLIAPGTPNSDDPYAFKVSQRTPVPTKKKMSRNNSKKANKQNIHSEMPVVISEDSEDTFQNPTSRKTSKRLKKKTVQTDELPNLVEIEAMKEKIAIAEDYELMLSQQFRDMEKTEAAKQHPKPTPVVIASQSRETVSKVPDLMSTRKSKWKRPSLPIPPTFPSMEKAVECQKREDNRGDHRMENPKDSCVTQSMAIIATNETPDSTYISTENGLTAIIQCTPEKPTETNASNVEIVNVPELASVIPALESTTTYVEDICEMIPDTTDTEPDDGPHVTIRADTEDGMHLITNSHIITQSCF